MAEEDKTFEPISINKPDNPLNIMDSLIPDPKLFAEKILKSSAVTCSITMPVQFHTKETTECITTTIPFYMSSDLGFGGISNTYGEMVAFDGLSSFTDLLNFGNTIKERSQVTMQSEAMSSKVWKGTKFDGFTIDCLFVSTRRRLNPTKIIRLLAATALPDKLRKDDITTAQFADTVKTWTHGLIDFGTGLGKNVVSGVNALGESFGKNDGPIINEDEANASLDSANKTAKKLVNDVGMIAPLYYGVKFGEERPTAPLANTTVTLQIGDWFRASELIVESISGISFSKEVIAMPNDTNGNRGGDLYRYDNEAFGKDYNYPLWGKCSLKLIPFSMMHKTKFEGYFIDHSTKENTTLDNLIYSTVSGLGGKENVVNLAENAFNYLDLTKKGE